MGHLDEASGARVRFAGYLLDGETKRLYRGVERIHLTPIPFNVLCFLVENRGRVVSQDELLNGVWRARRGKDSVEHAIRVIRRALGDHTEPYRFIETVPGHGYRFVALVSNDADESETAPACREVAPPERPGGSPAIFTRRGVLVSGGVGLGLGAVTLLGFTAFRRPRQIESISVNGQKLTAIDTQGSVAWEHHFDRPLTPFTNELERKRRVRVIRWGDAANGVLVAASHPSEVGSPVADEVLYCFSANGRLAWALPLTLELQDAYGQSFGPGWVLSDLLVTGGDTRPVSIWISLVHHLRFASGVLRIGPEGKPSLRFANGGNVQRLCAAPAGREILIVAAGVNNAVDRNCLAVFGENDSPAMSPDMGKPHYHYANEPTASPRAYALLPASEYNAIHRLPYSTVAWLYHANDLIVMRTVAGAWYHYTFEFALDLSPLKALHDGGEEANHHQLQAQGLVTHDYASCAERLHRLTMRRWTSGPGGGWQEIEIPWSGQS